jgi:hypothetical protein
MIASNVAVLATGLVNVLIQREAELEDTLLLQGMVVVPWDVVTALLAAMMMIDMMVDVTWRTGIPTTVLDVIVMPVIAMHQQLIVILVTDTVVQIVMHQVALPGKEAMREMEGGLVEVTTVMILGALVVMEEVGHVWGVDLLALVGVTEIGLPPMIALPGELALMMIATDEDYLGAEQGDLVCFSYQSTSIYVC